LRWASRLCVVVVAVLPDEKIPLGCRRQYAEVLAVLESGPRQADRTLFGVRGACTLGPIHEGSSVGGARDNTTNEVVHGVTAGGGVSGHVWPGQIQVKKTLRRRVLRVAEEFRRTTKRSSKATRCQVLFQLSRGSATQHPAAPDAPWSGGPPRTLAFCSSSRFARHVATVDRLEDDLTILRGLSHCVRKILPGDATGEGAPSLQPAVLSAQDTVSPLHPRVRCIGWGHGHHTSPVDRPRSGRRAGGSCSGLHRCRRTRLGQSQEAGGRARTARIFEVGEADDWTRRKGGRNRRRLRRKRGRQLGRLRYMGRAPRPFGARSLRLCLRPTVTTDDRTTRPALCDGHESRGSVHHLAVHDRCCRVGRGAKLSRFDHGVRSRVQIVTRHRPGAQMASTGFRLPFPLQLPVNCSLTSKRPRIDRDVGKDGGGTEVVYRAILWYVEPSVAPTCRPPHEPARKDEEKGVDLMASAMLHAGAKKPPSRPRSFVGGRDAGPLEEEEGDENDTRLIVIQLLSTLAVDPADDRRRRFPDTLFSCLGSAVRFLGRSPFSAPGRGTVTVDLSATGTACRVSDLLPARGGCGFANPRFLLPGSRPLRRLLALCEGPATVAVDAKRLREEEQQHGDDDGGYNASRGGRRVNGKRRRIGVFFPAPLHLFPLTLICCLQTSSTAPNGPTGSTRRPFWSRGRSPELLMDDLWFLWAARARRRWMCMEKTDVARVGDPESRDRGLSTAQDVHAAYHLQYARTSAPSPWSDADKGDAEIVNRRRPGEQPTEGRRAALERWTSTSRVPLRDAGDPSRDPACFLDLESAPSLWLHPVTRAPQCYRGHAADHQTMASGGPMWSLEWNGAKGSLPRKSIDTWQRWPVADWKTWMRRDPVQ